MSVSDLTVSVTVGGLQNVFLVGLTQSHMKFSVDWVRTTYCLSLNLQVHQPKYIHLQKRAENTTKNADLNYF